MRQLKRGTPPSVLAKFKHGTHSWKDLDFSDREAIWVALNQMQSQLCAYCEVGLGVDKHIEHFCTRDRHPQLTFDWGNLLGSCGRRDTCGTYKDQGFKKTQRSYECADLVNPSIHDPDDFFIFRESGRVEPRRGLNEADAARAELTIDVLNLNQDASKQGYICGIRERALKAYKDKESGFLEGLLELPVDERSLYLEAELEATQSQPYGTIIRHFLRALFPKSD